ncbi:carboxypeptidase-like regulatory domain-containing protein [Bacteroides sedimenti]
MYLRKRRRESLFFILLLVTCLSANAQIIKVRGTVLNEVGEPVWRANVTNEETNESVSTNEDGKYVITVKNNGKLKFTHMNYATEIVNVKGQLKIDLVLKKNAFMIKEVVVSGKMKKKTDPEIETTNIEIHGNWAIIKTSISPNKRFVSYNRLLMQPYVFNETKKEKYYLKPLALDGREYNITQTRIYGFDINKDPLAEFIVKKESERIPYVDSIYMNNLNDLWRCDAVQSVEDYTKIVFRDTLVIANGLINPLKLLKFDFAGDFLDDPSYFPIDEPPLMDDRDEMHLKFPIGQAYLDLSDSTTVADLSTLKKKLKDIESNQNAQLSTFEINGFASPDGIYEKNVKLAAKRMSVVMQEVLSGLYEGTRANIKSQKHSNVESWKKVADLMYNDSLKTEAMEITAIINKYPNSIDTQGKKITKLPYYQLIAAKYLPRLRKVDYMFSYKIYRSLTIQEIRELYQKNYKELGKYEFFKLYRNEKDSVKCEAIIRKALERYPNFIAAACDLSALCLRRGVGDSKILERYAGANAPEQVNLNHVASLLYERQFSRADSIIDFLKDNPKTVKIKAYTEVLNHRFTEENFKIVAASGVLNEVVMLLAMKKNGAAYRKAQELREETAEIYYIKAVCANRASKEAPDINSNAMLYLEAMDFLKKAIEKDPAYLRMAETDADTIDLLKDVTSQKDNQG